MGTVMLPHITNSLHALEEMYGAMNCDWEESQCEIRTTDTEEPSIVQSVSNVDMSNVFVTRPSQTDGGRSRNQHNQLPVGWNILLYDAVQIVPESERLNASKEEKEREKRKMLYGQHIHVHHRFKRLHGEREQEIEVNIAPRCGPPKVTLREVLSKIAPPREWISRGLFLRQYVSHAIPTTRDVLVLKEKADQECRQRKRDVAEDPLCETRRELNRKLFDELIRQVTVKCMERGLVLIQVRDEFYRQFHCYERLYHSLVASAFRSVLLSKQRCADTRFNIKALRKEIKALEKIHGEFPEAWAYHKDRLERIQLEDDQIYTAELDKLQSANVELKNLLKNHAVINTYGVDQGPV